MKYMQMELSYWNNKPHLNLYQIIVQYLGCHHPYGKTTTYMVATTVYKNMQA